MSDLTEKALEDALVKMSDLGMKSRPEFITQEELAAIERVLGNEDEYLRAVLS